MLLAVAGAGIPSISQSYDPLKWLPEDNRARVASEYLNRTLGGSAGMEIVFDSGEENGLHDPATLHRIEALQARLKGKLGGLDSPVAQHLAGMLGVYGFVASVRHC